MSNRKLSKVLPVILLVLFVNSIVAYSSDDVSKGFCVDRTGLGYNDVDSIKMRNENCTIDCIMKQGVVQSYHAKDGSPCWQSNTNENNYRCYLGVCRDLEAQKEAASMSNDDLYSLEISVLSANVPDMDDIPGAGGSDAFVIIDVENDGYPTYKRGELVCYTYVIQDNNRPRWSYTCKPLPMTGDTKLRFRLLDSDKPFSLNPDKLGQATEDVATLLSKGRTKLRLTGNQNDQIPLSKPYYLELEVKGKKYDMLS